VLVYPPQTAHKRHECGENIDNFAETGYSLYMKQLLSVFCIILFSAACPALFASGILDSPVPRVSAPAEDGASVWKISKDGNTLYLAGSVHVLRESDFPLPDEFEYAFSKSEILVLEADIGQVDNPEIMGYLLNRIFLPEGETLKTLLDPEVFDLLSEKCREYGMSINSVLRMKPSMVVNMLTVLQIQKLGFVQQGVDEYFFKKAKEENKPVYFLESVETQIDMLLEMGEGYDSEYVLYSLQDMDEVEDEIDSLVYEWRYGISGMTNGSLIELKVNWPYLYRSMILDRHDIWLPQIRRFLATGQVFFVVAGLAHMYGPDGLIWYLENSGCTVEKLRL